ncbi:hypothetical protein F5Y10DRAFT_284543 [Nemania abortiva]|nr:hypothetical protein F5Y10DRAFT_284543 [Nemania abortiva]
MHINRPKMSTDFVELGQKTFASSQALAWRGIRDHRHVVENAARRLGGLSLATQLPQEPDPPNPRPSSALEKLPEEVLIAIMECLDYESLYRLSQTTGYFLRLSFDSVFELDPEWRTFRYTVDEYFHELGIEIGARTRVLDWAKWRVKNPDDIAQDPESSRRMLSVYNAKSESGGLGEVVQQPLEPISTTRDTDEDDEGMTMLEFMARRYKRESDSIFKTSGQEEYEASP